jgi:periplasmic protein TonB
MMLRDPVTREHRRPHQEPRSQECAKAPLRRPAARPRPDYTGLRRRRLLLAIGLSLGVHALGLLWLVGLSPRSSAPLVADRLDIRLVSSTWRHLAPPPAMVVGPAPALVHNRGAAFVRDALIAPEVLPMVAPPEKPAPNGSGAPTRAPAGSAARPSSQQRGLARRARQGASKQPGQAPGKEAEALTATRGAGPSDANETARSSPILPPPAGPLVDAHFDADYLANPPPEYPLSARRLGLEGTVTLRVLVSPEGLPDAIDIRRSSGSSVLDRSALKAVRAWRFAPARRGDTPVASWVEVPVRFRLD